MRRTAVLGVLMMVGLTGLACASDAAATFPGRSGELMYSFSDSSGKSVDGSSGVHSYAPRTKTVRSVFPCFYNVSNVGSCFAFDAAVSADGQNVGVVVGDVVDSSSPLRYRLALVGPNGGAPRWVALERPAFDIAWSPDGEWLLATHYGGPTGIPGDGPPRVVLLDADGRTLGPVAGEGASDADWSAKGDIAYVQSGNLWITRLGGTPRQLTMAGGSSPSWSPSGRALAFVRGGRIWTIRADGTGTRRLAKVEASEPAWSPDGRYIAYLSAGGLNVDGPGLWTMRADGRCRPRAIIRAQGYLSYTSAFWRPLASSNAPRAYHSCLSRAEKRRLRRRCARKHGAAKRRCLAPLERAAR